MKNRACLFAVVVGIWFLTVQTQIIARNIDVKKQHTIGLSNDDKTVTPRVWPVFWSLKKTGMDKREPFLFVFCGNEISLEAENIPTGAQPALADDSTIWKLQRHPSRRTDYRVFPHNVPCVKLRTGYELDSVFYPLETFLFPVRTAPLPEMSVYLNGKKWKPSAKLPRTGTLKFTFVSSDSFNWRRWPQFEQEFETPKIMIKPGPWQCGSKEFNRNRKKYMSDSHSVEIKIDSLPRLYETDYLYVSGFDGQIIRQNVIGAKYEQYFGDGFYFWYAKFRRQSRSRYIRQINKS